MAARPTEHIEVMAPAGNFPSLTAAIQGGAHSVFLGVGEQNMRASSNINFREEDLARVVDQCHTAGVRVYQTVNTILYNEELPAIAQLLDASRRAGIDAIIASDQAAIVLSREAGLPVHLSTQLSISNTLSLKFYAQWADVAVLARELSLEQVGRITRDIEQQGICGPSGQPMRVEMFAHGALCMATSGKCYLSLHEANRSANRGQCVQICRRSYTLTDRETGNQIDVENQYLMSPKDLCTIHFLNKVIDSGVRVLKLEGRARSPEYVKMVTRCYREALDAIADGSYGPERIAEWQRMLATVFNRGFWDGYYLGQHLGEWSSKYGSSATERKQILGLVTNYFARVGVAEIRVEALPLNEGDELFIIGETTGVLEVAAHDIRLDEQTVPTAPQRSVVSMRVPARVRRGDKVFLRIRGQQA
ncbi:MAG: collagenase-like protease [Bacteroidia bacterium]|nr:MAG: collagenase-like protease [Bacteroidia bacterium]